MGRTKSATLKDVEDFKNISREVKSGIVLETAEEVVEIIPDIEFEEKINNVKEILRPLKDDESFLPNGERFKIIPTKIKNIKDGSFSSYKIIENMTVVGLLKYTDGEEIIKKFILSTTDLTSELLDKYFDEFSVDDIMDIVSKAKTVNGIKDDFFETPPKETEE